VKESLHTRTKSGNIRPHDVRIRAPLNGRMVGEELKRDHRDDRTEGGVDRRERNRRARMLAHGRDLRATLGQGPPKNVGPRSFFPAAEGDHRFFPFNREEGTVQELFRMVAACAQSAGLPDL